MLTLPIDRARVEERTLSLLELVIIDLELWQDGCIHDGYTRWHVYRGGRSLCDISTMGGRYYTRSANNLLGYPTLYQACTFWVGAELTTIERAARLWLEENDLDIPDYM